jgi:hypothetical protein
VDDTGNITEYSEQDVDEEIGVTAALKEDTERWEHDGEDDLDEVAGMLLVPVVREKVISVKHTLR